MMRFENKRKSGFKLNNDTIRIAKANFTEETTDREGNYMLRGHWWRDLCYQFAKICDFVLVQVDGYSSYAYSDEQMAILVYCEGDIHLTIFDDRTRYERDKAETIRFYKEEY